VFAEPSKSFTTLAGIELPRTTDGSLATVTSQWKSEESEVAVVAFFRSFG